MTMLCKKPKGGTLSSTRDPAKPHPTAAEGTQVMSVDEVPQIRTLTVYQASLDDEFNIDSQ